VVIYSGGPTYNWYLAGAELRDAPKGKPPIGMEHFTLPKRRCMALIHISRVHPSRISWNELRNVYAYLFQEWIPAHLGRPAEGRHLEYDDLAETREDFGQFSILIPLAEKLEERV
jgi:predicted transcriptional regulator YdeE